MLELEMFAPMQQQQQTLLIWMPIRVLLLSQGMVKSGLQVLLTMRNAVPVTGTELAEGLASDPLSADIGGDSYPTNCQPETFLKMLQGIPEKSLQENEVEMIPNPFYFKKMNQ